MRGSKGRNDIGEQRCGGVTMFGRNDGGVTKRGNEGSNYSGSKGSNEARE